MGRWIDFRNDYKTLYPWFMETIWWVFRQLYDKGLVYRGYKVHRIAMSIQLCTCVCGLGEDRVHDHMTFPWLPR